MSSATRHIEGDPLEALRSELVAAGRRRVARRRRGRRTAAVVGALVGLLALAAGAGALMNFSTGVPAVDTLLEIESPNEPGRDIRPGPGQAAEPLAVPTGDGTADAVAYLARDGRICHVTADGSSRGSTGGCWALADLSRALDRRAIVWNGLTAGADNRVFDGYADGEVDAIRVAGGGDAITVKLSGPWTPQVAGATPLRHFVVIDEEDIDVGGEGVQMDETERLTQPFPPLAVTMSDGTTRRIASR